MPTKTPAEKRADEAKAAKAEEAKAAAKVSKANRELGEKALREGANPDQRPATITVEDWADLVKADAKRRKDAESPKTGA